MSVYYEEFGNSKERETWLYSFTFAFASTSVQCYTKSNCNKVICMMKEDLLRARSFDIARMVYRKTLESLTLTVPWIYIIKCMDIWKLNQTNISFSSSQKN